MLPPRTIVRSILLVASLLVFAPGLSAQGEVPPDDVTQEVLKFTRLYGVIADQYMDPLDPDPTVFDGGIRGMLTALDPFSSSSTPTSSSNSNSSRKARRAASAPSCTCNPERS